jgi:hypothetical protein
MAYMVECLHSKCEALSLNPSTAEEKGGRGEGGGRRKQRKKGRGRRRKRLNVVL